MRQQLKGKIFQGQSYDDRTDGTSLPGTIGAYLYTVVHSGTHGIHGT